MIREQDLWNEVASMIKKSNRKIQMFEGKENIGHIEIEALGLNRKSILGVIILYTSGICVDNWIRIIGQNCLERKGIIMYNEPNERRENTVLKGMLIIGQDVVGGIFAINREKFVEGIHKIWYFAPDTLEWECLDMSYAEFIAWLMQGDIDEFYSSMRWDNWMEDCRNINFNEVLLIYPFLWSKECDLKKISKKAVPYEELMGINFEYAQKFN